MACKRLKIRPRSLRAMHARRSVNDDCHFLLSTIFSREHCMYHYAKAFVLLSGRSSSTNDIGPIACYILIFRAYFGDEQDTAANTGYGLNQMKNLVVLYQQTEM